MKKSPKKKSYNYEKMIEDLRKEAELSELPIMLELEEKFDQMEFDF